MVSTTSFRIVAAASDRAVAPVLDEVQERIASHERGPLLVVGGPGTGKTTALVEHVVRRVQAGEDPRRILVLTSSRKAALEMRRRVAARAGHTTATVAAMTFHAFCHQIVTRFGVGDDPLAAPPRLLTAPEQDYRMREAMAGTQAVAWPDDLAAAVGTRAFSEEVVAVMTRARQLGMEPADVAAAGRAASRPAWEAVGSFFEEYVELLDLAGVLDYAELTHRTRLLLADPEVGAAIRRHVTRVVVDEYQECDEAQVAVLSLLAGRGGRIVAAGDPDESIDAFRGAQGRAVADFTAEFGQQGTAEVVVLPRTRRHGAALATALGGIADRLGTVGSLGADTVARLRHPEPLGPAGLVEVHTCDSAATEAARIAHLLRTAHLVDGVPWSQMAVLTRQGRRTLPALARALTTAGVPVQVVGDDVALASEPAVAPLLLGLELACADEVPTPTQARALMLSWLGGLDPVTWRRAGRRLRALHPDGETPGGRRADELLAQALVEPGLLAREESAPEDELAAVARVAQTLAAVRTQIEAGRGPHAALWELWRSTPWPTRLQERAWGRGPDAARAQGDLDAVCALFDLASRREEADNRGVADFLAEVVEQQIPADTDREEGPRSEAVRLSTAHRAKGQEWDLVVVAGVQEGAWPDLRRHDGVLEAVRLTRAGVGEAEPLSASVARERRLFLVACSRARRRLVVTAVDDPESDAGLASRFLDDLGVAAERWEGRPTEPTTLPALVAELRRVGVDPSVSPLLREAAAQRLAVLADAVDDEGHPLAPWADPDRWWGMHDPDVGPVELARPDEPVRLTGSALESMLECPRRWYLERQVGAQTPAENAASLGTIVHALAEHAALEGWGLGELTSRLDEVWGALRFEAAWRETAEREIVEAELGRFLAWQELGQRTLLGTEVPYEVEIDLGDDRVVLTGTVDRLEREPDGGLVIVDLKTGRNTPTGPALKRLDQLGVYQLAAAHGAFEELAPGCGVAGAEVVHLRVPGTNPLLPKVGRQDPPTVGDAEGEGPTWVHDRLLQAARLVRAGRFPAQACQACDRCRFATSCPVTGAGSQVLS